MLVHFTGRGVRWLAGAVVGITLAGMFGAAPPADARPPVPLAAASDPVDSGSLSVINQIIGADQAWAAGYTGAGVDVALIDTGVALVPGIQSANVVNGPDLSFDGQTMPEDQRMIDGFGHGTHLAGIIAGRDTASSGDTGPAQFMGVAPDARLINVKVGAYDGSTDVSQVIAAVNWVVEHRTDNGINIRVLNLSYGTLSTQDAMVDPLAFAVEAAWRAGIVVVVAGGNDGLATNSLSNPAYDPLVIAVGASDPHGTLDVADDTIPAFATHGNKKRSVDVVAPGVGVLSLNVPGSFIDQTFYGAAGPQLVRGSGTSQSAAVVSGAAALVLQRYPQATPDQVKAQLKATATPMAKGTLEHKGTGVVNVAKAVTTPLPKAKSAKTVSLGTGSLEAARGPDHLSIDGNVLAGEQDIFGNPWNGSLVARAPGSKWKLGIWNGSRWSGDGWSAAGWTNVLWDQASWAGTDFVDVSLSTAVWDGSRWSGSRWSGSRWSGSRWSGSRWSSAGWA